ncbi:uncharacterized protein LOC135201363 [Macrobrachium nipponense]|uniref:uncharacterized protein LOC135201363 n=1 Tax=Macrobrachium nipponense TaxID=159736 RepID=UPI0030C7CEFA
MDSNTTHVELRHDILRKLSDVIDRKFKDECRDIGAALILEVLDFLQFSDDERLEKKVSSDPPFAVVYIAVILLFFAASVFVVLVKYMRKESESSRLEHFYQNYQDGKRARLIVRYDTEGRPLPIKTAYSSARRSIIPLDIGTPSPTPSEVQTPLDTPNSSIATVPPLGLLEHDL